MASSRNRPSAELFVVAREALAGLGLEGRILVAGLSGGRDSVVLLSVLRELAPVSGFRLRALHVNHGLSPNAARWERFCRALCRDWKVPLAVRRVRVEKSGVGPEAAAREARRAAFAAAEGDAIAFAHHLDDQAETVLMNLLRGAGLRGASGMPAVGVLGDKRLLRPLLSVPREAIERHARGLGLDWVDDESNADAAFTRNFVRLSLAPLLVQRFPRWRENLARAARHFAARDLGKADALRARLAEAGLRAPSEARLAEMLRQFGGARPDARVAIEHDGAVLRVARGRLAVTAKRVSPAFVPVPWRGERRLALAPLGGELRFRFGAGGIDPVHLAGAGLVVDLRRAGARLRPRAGGPSRTLKNLFQEAGVPQWERERLPMLWSGDALVWAPGLGVDAAFAAARGWLPDWRPAEGGSAAIERRG